MASPHYRNKYNDCPICSCNQFDAGFIDERLKADYWPEGAPKPDFQALSQELESRFDITVSEDEIKQHWELHVALRLDGYREWAREKTKHSPGEDPYGMGLVDDG